MIKYLRTLGFNVVNDVFADNSWYFRNALVRANYSDLTQGITETTIYLVNFFRSMLLGEEHDLRNRMMHIEWKKTQDITEIQSANNTVQSAKTEENLLSKCKNCTLEEMALLRIVQNNPFVTQKEMAAQMGKSPDFVIAYPKKYKSYNFSRQECKKQGFSRIGGRACYFTRLFARLPKQQKQPLIIKHLQTYFEKVTKSGKRWRHRWASRNEL